MPHLKELYPEVDEAAIKKVIIKGAYKMRSLLANGHEIMLNNPSKYKDRDYFMRIFEPMGITPYNEAAKNKAYRKHILRNEREKKRHAQLSEGTSDGQSDSKHD